MSLKAIFAATNTPISTCSDIIKLSKMRHAKNSNLKVSHNPCADENLKPTLTCTRGVGRIFSDAQKQYVIDLALRQSVASLKSLSELVAESKISRVEESGALPLHIAKGA